MTATEPQTVATRLSPSDYARVERLARRSGLSVDEYLRRALADEIRYDEVVSRGGEVIIRERDGRQERVRYGC